MRNESISILSVNFEVKTKKEQLDKVKKRLDSGLTTKIFTPNPQIILKAVKDKKTLNLLKLSDINLPDGIGIALASSLLGKKLPERISGIDFAQELLFLAAKHKYSVFLLGGKSGRAHKARRALCQRIPNLNVCGCHNGYFNKVGTDNERIKKIIQSSRPDFLFVCLGSPCQEKWIAENISSFPSVKLAIGLGGSIDVWSGKIKRAPYILRKYGLEWLWRTVKEPRRAKIFIDIPKFLICVLAQKRASCKVQDARIVSNIREKRY